MPCLRVGWEMSSTDISYYRRRADEERQLAKTTQGKMAVIHEELADRYEALMKLLNEEPPSRAA